MAFKIISVNDLINNLVILKQRHFRVAYRTCFIEANNRAKFWSETTCVNINERRTKSLGVGSLRKPELNDAYLRRKLGLGYSSTIGTVIT